MIRKTLGMKTQIEFSQKIETSLSTIKSWECGKHKPPAYLGIMLDCMEKQYVGATQALQNKAKRAILIALGRDHEKLVNIQNTLFEPDCLYVSRVVTESGRWVFSVGIIPFDKVQGLSVEHGALLFKLSLPDFLLTMSDEPTKKEDAKLKRETIKHVAGNIDEWASKVITHFVEYDKNCRTIKELFN